LRPFQSITIKILKEPHTHEHKRSHTHHAPPPHGQQNPRREATQVLGAKNEPRKRKLTRLAHYLHACYRSARLRPSESALGCIFSVLCPHVLGEWVNPHRAAHYTAIRSNIKPVPKVSSRQRPKRAPNQAAITTAAETPGTVHRARPRSPFSRTGGSNAGVATLSACAQLSRMILVET